MVPVDVVRVEVRLPRVLHDRLRVVARGQDRSVNWVVVHELEKALAGEASGRVERAARRVGEGMLSVSEARREAAAIWPDGAAADASVRACLHLRTRSTGYGKVCEGCGAFVK